MSGMVEKKLFKSIKEFIKQECTHQFKRHEMADLTIDPKCIYCDTKLSDLDEKSKLQAL